MATKGTARNPYIAGRALGQRHDLVGREDVFRLVETELSSPNQNAVVLFGQRRIGKTSILRRLQLRLPSPPFVPIYFDLMDQARKPLGQVLFAIASTVAAEVGMHITEAPDFDNEGIYFRQTFLPALYEVLGHERRLVLLLDEFDVLDVAAEERLLDVAAARSFFPYLRQLMHGEPLLGFVFVVGRRAEDLSIDVKATFKSARHKRVSVLDEVNAQELIMTAQREQTLLFDQAAVSRILTLTAGHPYFIQLLCQILWEDAHVRMTDSIPTIDVNTVDTVIPKVLEAGENIFEWIWDGLPPAERVISAAIAQFTNEQVVITEEELLELLQRHGIRILTRELELAPSMLHEWEVLRKKNSGYAFFIELMRRWIAVRKPLPKVKDELDRVVPLADTLYLSGNGFYRQRDLDNAYTLLQQALRLNPNHLKARLLLGQLLVEQGKLEEAVRELKQAYSYDEDVARYPLIRALLIQGEECERCGDEASALSIYDHVLNISPREKVAQERSSAIWVKRGDEAVQVDDLDTALDAYRKSGMPDKIAQIEPLQRQRKLNSAAGLAQELERLEIWDDALAMYEWLKAEDPDNQGWSDAVNRVKLEDELHKRYAEAIIPMNQQAWSQAMRSLADVVYLRPDYRDAAELLAQVVQKHRSSIQQGILDLHHLDVAAENQASTAAPMTAESRAEVLGDTFDDVLHSIIVKFFSLKSLREICHDLGIDYDNVPGTAFDNKARGLVDYCTQRGKSLILVERCCEIQGDAPWEHLQATLPPHALIYRALDKCLHARKIARK
jgi:tetratricopeptide (TPR) repeat protein